MTTVYLMNHRRHYAFNLIEVLIAMAIGMTLIMAATLYLYSVSQAYVQLQEDPVFEDHVEGVVALLDSFIGTTSQNPSTRAANPEAPQSVTPSRPGNRRKGKGDMRWEEPPGAGILKSYTLAFSPSNASPFFSALPGASPTFTGYLMFVRNEGLFLLYQTQFQKKEDPNAVSAYLLSPYVTAMEFAFYSQDQWIYHPEMPPAASEDNPLLPTAIRLKFEDAGHEAVRYVYVSSQ